MCKIICYNCFIELAWLQGGESRMVPGLACSNGAPGGGWHVKGTPCNPSGMGFTCGSQMKDPASFIRGAIGDRN